MKQTRRASGFPTLRSRVLCLLVVIGIAGCEGAGDGGGTNERIPELPAYVTVTVRPTAMVENVQELRLAFLPARLWYQGGAVAVLTDDNGQNSTNHRHCNTVAGTEVCDQVTSTVSAQLIDTQRSPSLRIATIAEGFTVPNSTYSTIYLQWVGVPNQRDSYVILSDGRECEINVPSGEDVSIRFNEAFSMWAGGDHRILNLTLNIAADQFDPARCADGYELQATAGAAVP